MRGVRRARVASFAAAPPQQPNQVANFYAGQPGTASYQHFSFWSHEGRRYNLQYSRDSLRTDVTAHYAGPARVAGQPGFRVALAGGRTLYVVPADSVLLVRTASLFEAECAAILARFSHHAGG